jgi:hypothetical protein
MRADPVGQSLRQARFGIGIAADAQHGDKQSRWPHLARAGVMDGNSGPGIVDKQFLAGPVFVPQHNLPAPQPAAVEIAVSAVTIAVGAMLTVLFPEQLQGYVLIGLQLVENRGVIRFWWMCPALDCLPRWSHRLPQSVVVPIGDVRPFQTRCCGGLQVIGNRRLTDGTAQRDLAL